MAKTEEIKHEGTDFIVCPFCGYEVQDSWECADSGEFDCYGCDRTFFFERQVEVTYTTRPVIEPEKETDNES